MNRLLILDDELRIAEILKRSIEEFEGYEKERVDVSTTPLEALELTRDAADHQRPYTVFLIDQRLGAELDGIQTMKELLAINASADAIIFTGFENPEDGIRAYAEGASRYLPKTFDPEELAFVLKDLAHSRRFRLDAARQHSQFKVATDIAEAVGASVNLEKTMNAVLETLRGVFEKTRLCVLLYDKREKKLRFAPATLSFYEIGNPQYAHQDAFDLNQGSIACRVARKAMLHKKVECETVGDVSQDADYLNLNPSTNSECCVSLLNTHNELLGVLALERERLNGFAEDDLDLIKMAARHIGIAIERAQQSEALEFKSTFAARTSWAANIAHEVYNKVGNILTWAYLIKNTAEDNSEIKEWANYIEESVRELSNAIPRDNAPTEIANLDDALKSILDQITVGRNVETEFMPDAADVFIRVNLAYFQHVFRHLLNNAMRAMNDIDEKKIIVVTKALEDKAEIHFEDIGAGICDDKRASIFHRPFTTQQNGGGFGLLYVREIIEEMMKGEIELLPYQEGRGAIFCIQIPIAMQEQDNRYDP